MIEKVGEADSVGVDSFEDAIADETQTKTRDRVSKLLGALGIEVVIAVDDIHYSGGEGNSAEITESMAGAPDLLSSIVELLRLDATHLNFESVDETDPSAVSDFINVNWTGFSAHLRNQLLGAVRTLQRDREENVEESEIAHDVKAQGALRAVFDGVVEFMQMSMTEWNAGWRELLADDRKYLVLIDRTFNREQHGGEETGDEILGELLSAQLDSVWAGLFTRHARDEDGERDLTKALREKHPDQANRVAAIGKFRTTSIALLPAGLRALLLVRELNAYRELAKGALSTAGESASEQFELLSDYAIVEAIAAAQEEGTFELEHPLRLAQRLFAHALLVRFEVICSLAII
ncbi:hypothetical protein [Klugiella xanthotipulae]|uniref:Uncharacterized protein n=1 Tax=Klugiella xanthotipulae TaxID=244735 RepID=A0A543HTA8_9MICO|nr:hypothetical protein [Klugiella xanthotipulae]TQM61591.1 hypothetical protein FB466_2550 [Klugiella xanthotipulae]